MKKVLIVITKGEVGGAQMFVSALAKNLHRQGHTVTVAYGEGDYLRDALTPEGIPVVRFRWLRRTNDPIANIRFGWELRTFLKAHNFDIVHFNSSNALFGVIGARLMRSHPKIVFTLHGLSIVDPNYAAFAWIKPLYKIVFKMLLALVDEPVFVSQLNYDYAKKINLVKQGTVIPNGIDTNTLSFLDRNEALNMLGEKARTDLSNKFIIGSIGRLAYPKNYEFLIRTFPRILEEIPNATVVIIGEGPEQKRYMELIKKGGLNEKIFLVNGIYDAHRYIKAFDLFVLPSEYEGMSMTLIEAMFAEVPILASHVGGTPELLNDPTQTYALNNVADFIAKLKAHYARKGFPYTKERRAYRSKFEGERMATEYLKLYEKNHSS